MLLLLFVAAVSAQGLKKVEGYYLYHAPENVTLEQAKRTALDRAKIDALAKAFGTVVSQTTGTRVKTTNGESDVDVLSFGGSEVKGEWIETIGEPVYVTRYEGDMLVVEVSVKGRAREIVSAGINFEARVLRNGTEVKFEDQQFRSGDDLYLSFVSPVSGYLAVYLIDQAKQAMCLLPYAGQTIGVYPINANQQYTFFNSKSAPLEERPLVDEYQMTCDDESEFNQIYLVFSPNSFSKAVDSDGTWRDDGLLLPRNLPYDKFMEWLVKCRKRDKDMQAVVRPLTVTK